MKKKAQLFEEEGVVKGNRVSRRQMLQLLGIGIAGAASSDILTACLEGSNPPAVTGTVTASSGATRSLTPFFLGYNNVPFLSPSWTNPEVVKVATQLKPGTLRSPGGTVANYWDWQTGWFVPGAPFNSPRSPYGLPELQIAVQTTAAKPVYVLNMLTSHLDSQLNMLRTAKQMGLPVNFVELGNEFYLSSPEDYKKKVSDGRRLWFDGNNLDSSYP
jgi:hypothetical protein